MRTKIQIALLCIVLCGLNCLSRVSTKTETKRVSILYITDWNIAQSPKIASLIKNEKAINECLVLLNTPVFTGTKPNQYPLLADILNTSQIDACIITPDFLTIGIINCKEFIRKSNFYCLAANLKEKTTATYIGQEYMIKPFNKFKLALIGVVYDTLNPDYLNPDYELLSPEYSVLKLIPLVKNRSDFICLLTNCNDSLDFLVDLILGAHARNNISIIPEAANGIFKIEISFDNNQDIIEMKRSTLSSNNYSDDIEIINLIKKHQ